MSTARALKKGTCSSCNAPARSASISISEKNGIQVTPAGAQEEKCSPRSAEAYVCTECGHIDFYAPDVNVFKEPNR